MTRIPTKIVAGASLVALGSLAGYTVGSGPAAEQQSALAQKRRPVEVRTQTIRRTVRIVKHARPPRNQPAAAPAPVAPAAGPVSSTPRFASPQPSGSVPVSTRTSGGGAAGGEREHGETGERGEREAGDD